MALANAFSKNTLSLAVEQSAYKTNVIAVNTLITSVLSSTLPTLNTNPPDWNEFVAAYEKADADALNWVNNVMARLLNVPDEVRSYNPTINLLLNDAKTQAQKLIKNPSDPIALSTLKTDLNNVNSQFSLVVTFIAGALTAIQEFKDILPNLATELQTIATKSSSDAKADEAEIVKLQADIQAFNDEIKSLTASLVALGIADAAALSLGTLATIAAWPEGALVWLVLGPIVAVATTYIAIDGEKIVADKKAIVDDQNKITGITADVATLHILATNYAAMATQTDEIEANLKAILAEWQILESDVNLAITDIKDALSDTATADFGKVVLDLDDAITEWAATYKQAGDLNITLNVNDAQYSVGMTSAEVKTATDNGKTTDIIKYYNQVQNMRASRAA
ncbi:MAG: enterotoxin (HBL) [Cellvibrionales bacterium]|nr:enterotoxin (HBL) [Cellvibrionales bacterium]